jgi:hypothetical protein
MAQLFCPVECAPSSQKELADDVWEINSEGEPRKLVWIVSSFIQEYRENASK